MNVDVLILGGGLAGSVCAWQWHLRGYSVVVVDQPGHSNSSRVAGGLLNPITGMRFVVDPLFLSQREEALSFYHQIELVSGEPLFHDLPQWRIFQNDVERGRWLKRMGEPLVHPWHGPLLEEADFPLHINAPLGGFEIQQAGWLNMNALIQQTRTHLPFREGVIDDARIKCRSDAVCFEDIVAKHAIFCRGYRETYHHFPAPELQHAKGEILLLSIPDLPVTHSINKGGWLLPIGNGLWKAGATYEWKDLNETLTEKGKDQLLDRISKIIRCPIEVVDQLAGVRPTTKQRDPLLLHHADTPLSLLNGLGSKGTLLAPYTSRVLLEQMTSIG